jgi:hypothetical protein
LGLAEFCIKLSAPRLSIIGVEIIHGNSLFVGPFKHVTVILVLLTAIPAASHSFSLALFLALSPEGIDSGLVAHTTFLDLLILKSQRAFVVKDLGTIFISQISADLAVFLKVLVLIIA